MSIYRFSLGKFECVAIQDQDQTATAERLFGEYPREEWLPLVNAYESDIDAIKISNTCLIVKTDGDLILFDGGDGTRNEDSHGHMLANLQEAGFDPADFSVVVLSHGHGDHYGGLTDGKGNLIFPNARHLVWKAEWEHWTSDDRMPEIEAESPERAEQIRQYLLPIASKLELIEDQTEFVSGIHAVPAPGHTFAHTAFHIQSEGESLLYIADAALHPVFFERLDWAFSNDYDKAQSGKTRDQLAKLAVEHDALVLVYHFKFPGLGRIYQENETWKWRAIE